MVDVLHRTGDYCSEIVEKHGAVIYRICRLHLKNTADVEDVFQTVFLKLIEKQPYFRDEDHERAWLIKVAVNKCKDYLKSYWNKNKVSIEDYDGTKEESDLSEVYEAVSNLEPHYKIVIYMYYYEGYSTSEMSKILKVKEATIRTRLKRAREHLKIQLKGDEFYE
jgi:RNA polymerase sigma factor (sigma-70 family)